MGHIDFAATVPSFPCQLEDGPIGKAEAEDPGECRQAAEGPPGAATVGEVVPE
jgi:hypothetical protein